MTRTVSSVLPLYVSRPLLNVEDVYHHYLREGYPEPFMDAPNKWHVTLAYSKTPVAWAGFYPNHFPQAVDGPYEHDVFGDTRDIHVLKFESPRLQLRWEAIKAMGAVWSYPTYQPHLTIGRALPSFVDWTGRKPYTGPLILGPERWEVIREMPAPLVHP